MGTALPLGVLSQQDQNNLIVKEPENSQTTPQARSQFMGSIESSGLEKDLKYKYRDVFLYEWASGCADKRIFYWVLIGLSSISTSELQRGTDSSPRNLPVEMPNSWVRPIVSGFGVLNLATWNRNFLDLAVARLSTSS